MRKSLLPLALLILGCQTQKSLVPDQVSDVPDYFSTWNIQGYAVSYDGPETHKTVTEQYMFGDGPLEGWIRFFPDFREDLLYLMDDSWDLPFDHITEKMGEARLNTDRFPSFTGTPVERLSKLAKATKDAGWKGLGGWICARESDAPDASNPEAYWATRLKESEEAGMHYWKVDYGKEEHNEEWRRMMTHVGHEVAPKMFIEHAYTYPGIEHFDAFRTYDVEVITAVPVTIQRIAKLLGYKHDKDNQGLINCEDEPYIAAGLGCVIGVMRHPINKDLPNGQSDHVFPATGRDLKSRLDEVNRLLKWHRIAAPFGVDNDAKIDEKELTDRWILAERETWVPSHHPGDTLIEKAPARISRNLPLPEVKSEEKEAPYVMSSLYPNGALAIAAVERVLGRRWYTPKAMVTQKVPDLAHPIGIFGTFGQVILESKTEIPRKPHVWAQDLIAKKATEITDQVKIEGRRLILSGELIQTIGTQAATAGDKSAPGLVLVVK